MHVEEVDFYLENYRFELPQAQIAQFPPRIRGDSRLLVLSRKDGQRGVGTRHAMFTELANFLPEGALLVVNNSKVLQARLLGTRSSGGSAEFLLLTPLPFLVGKIVPDKSRGDGFFYAECEGLLRCGARVREGDVFDFGAGIRVTVLASGEFGRRRVRIAWQGALDKVFSLAGHIPLPPYIRRRDVEEDLGRYQTIYAREDKAGSVAAPTAGLHFTEELRDRLTQRGFGWAEVTLYVGYGTFSPVRTEDIRKHRMHEEYFEISESAASAVAEAKAQGRPVIAVGTTSVRALEGCFRHCGKIAPFAGWTDIFLYPGCRFHVVDGLLTNFHLPESSLIMLVAAFAGRERVLAAYAEAVAKGYRFFSYGDAMFIA